MIVTTRTTQEVRITNPETSEITTISMADESPGKGRVIVTGAGQTNSCYWNNMGERTVREFFLLSTDAYIVGCLDPFGTLFRKIDPAKLIPIVVKDIEDADNINDEQKVLLTARTIEFRPISDVNGLQVLNAVLMKEIYGPMWTTQVNERFLGQHPLYEGLLARVALIRQVLEG